jgi:hypothetical protein
MPKFVNPLKRLALIFAPDQLQNGCLIAAEFCPYKYKDRQKISLPVLLYFYFLALQPFLLLQEALPFLCFLPEVLPAGAGVDVSVPVEAPLVDVSSASANPDNMPVRAAAARKEVPNCFVFMTYFSYR